MSFSQRVRSSRASSIARRVYAPQCPGQRLEAARAIVATMDVTQAANGTTYLLRRDEAGALIEFIRVPAEAMPLLAVLLR